MKNCQLLGSSESYEAMILLNFTRLDNTTISMLAERYNTLHIDDCNSCQVGYCLSINVVIYWYYLFHFFFAICYLGKLNNLLHPPNIM